MNAFDLILIGFIKVILEVFMDDCLNQECPHCGRPLNLPNGEQIEKWLKGDK